MYRTDHVIAPRTRRTHVCQPRRTALAAVVALLLGAAPPVYAQHEHQPPAPLASAEPMSGAVHEAMTRNMVEGTHVRLSPTRAGTRTDSARALAIADILRAAIAKYADTAAAVRDGYKLFAPNIKAQLVLHYSKWTSALAESFRFDPAQPTSLLYTREADGRLKLIGAMYTAPKSVRDGELDRRGDGSSRHSSAG